MNANEQQENDITSADLIKKIPKAESINIDNAVSLSTSLAVTTSSLLVSPKNSFIAISRSEVFFINKVDSESVTQTIWLLFFSEMISNLN